MIKSPCDTELLPIKSAGGNVYKVTCLPVSKLQADSPDLGMHQSVLLNKTNTLKRNYGQTQPHCAVRAIVVYRAILHFAHWLPVLVDTGQHANIDQDVPDLAFRFSVAVRQHMNNTVSVEKLANQLLVTCTAWHVDNAAAVVLLLVAVSFQAIPAQQCSWPASHPDPCMHFHQQHAANSSSQDRSSLMMVRSASAR